MRSEAKEEDEQLARVEKPYDSSLVHRFVEFSFHTINVEMSSFFEDNLSIFNQDMDDLRSQGETVEQYSIYLEYKKKLEEKIDQFSVQENFDSEEELIFAINTIVQEDLLRHKKQMEEMLKQIRKAQKKILKRLKREHEEREGLLTDAKSDSENENSGDEDNDRDDSKLGLNPNMLMFFNPTTLDQLVEMVLNLGEYQTFSMMMRMKMQQKRIIALQSDASGGGYREILGEGKEGEGEGGEEGKKEEEKDDDINACDDDGFFFEG